MVYCSVRYVYAHRFLEPHVRLYLNVYGVMLDTIVPD